MRQSRYLIPLALLLSITGVIFAQKASDDIPPPLAKGTKVVAGPSNTDEFYVIAENDEPQLRTIIAETEHLANMQKATLYAMQKKPASIAASHPQVLAHKKSPLTPLKKLRPQKLGLAQKSKINKAVPTTKLAIKKVRVRHKPSAMEIALNNALEKAIKKKQFGPEIIAKNTAVQPKLAAKKEKKLTRTVTPSRDIAIKKIAMKLAKIKSAPKSIPLKRTKLAVNK